MVIASLLFNCTPSRVSGVETTNGNTVVALLPSGLPAMHAGVLIINQQNWANNAGHDSKIIADSLRTDMGGKFLIPSQYFGNHNIQIDAPEGGQLLRLYGIDSLVHTADKVDTTRLSP